MAKKRKQNEPKRELRDELKEFSLDDLERLFKRAIEDQASKGILNANEAKELLRNIRKFLAEEIGELL